MNRLDKELVLGSSCIEKTYSLLHGSAHEADTTLRMYLLEDSFGGSGLCNALASRSTGVINEINFATVGGEVNGQPDSECLAIKQTLAREGINTHLQLHPGRTEQTNIILSGSPNDPKRGFRESQRDGTLLRDRFNSNDPRILDLLTDQPVIIASSFSAQRITHLAKVYRYTRPNNGGLFIWTLNSESAQSIARNEDIQSDISSGVVDAMFMTKHEQNIIQQDLDLIRALNAVKTLVVTDGGKGCEVREKVNGHDIHLKVPPFQVVDRVQNDNGAGECHHNNFLATLFSVQNELSQICDYKFRTRVLETACRIANLAAFIKIQQLSSLWFPSLPFERIRENLIESSYSPEEITKQAYHLFLEKEKRQIIRV